MVAMTTKFRSEFHGVSDERKQVGGDLFASDLYFQLCKDQAARMGLRRDRDPFATSFLRRLKHSLRPSRWPQVVKSLAAGSIPDFETEDYLVPLVAAIRATIKAKGTCSVLDIGGGWGDNYLLIGRALLNERKHLHYTVVDNERLSKLGAELYSARSQPIAFSEGIPTIARFDFILLCGTLQYIDDWKSFLPLCKQAADTIYLARTTITDGKGFYTDQTVFIDDVKAGVAPFRLFGRDELANAMGGWALAMEKETGSFAAAGHVLAGSSKAVYLAQLWLSPRRRGVRDGAGRNV